VSVTVAVSNTNDAPTDITLSAASLIENAGANATVGTLGAIDADVGDTFTFSFVAGVGSADNGSFNITSGNILRLTPSADFETKSSYSVRIQVQDAGGLTHSKAFTITVIDGNDAPTDVSLSPATIAENSAADAVVGTLSATDVDAGDTHVFSFVSGDGSADNAAFDIVGSTLTKKSGGDFETKPSYAIRVRARDQSGAGLTFDKALVVTLTDVNEAPSAITLSSSAVAEGVAGGSLVAGLGATDVDAGDSFVFGFAVGDGDEDNGDFSIVGNSLNINGVPNLVAKASYNIRLLVQDQAGSGLVHSQAFTIAVTNTNDAPTISDVPPQSTDEDTTLAGVNVVINDVDSSLSCGSSLVASSSNSALVPVSNISFSGSAPNCTATLIPAPNANGTATITLTVSDGSLSAQDSFLLTVNAVNDTPVANVLGGALLSTTENTAGVVSLTTGLDPDTVTNGQSLVYEITSPPSNGSLGTLPASALVGGNLAYTPTAAFTGVDGFAYRICDTHGVAACTSPYAVTVTVINTNDAPTDISLSSQNLVENSGSNAVVGSLSAVDPDPGESFSYSLVAGSGDSDNNFFALTGNVLRHIANPNYEFRNSYSIRVQVQDVAGLIFSKSFVISIIDVNESPTNIVLSNSAIDENLAPGTAIGTVSASDPDAGQTFTFSLAAGSGDSDNGAVSVSGTTVSLVGSANHEVKSSYAIRIEVVDQGGLTFQKAFVISVNNVNEAPTIADVSNQSTTEDSTITGIDLAIGDVDSSLVCASSLSAASSNTAVLPVAGIVFAGTAPACTVSIVPAANAHGTAIGACERPNLVEIPAMGI
jgi:hypothetical protein